MTPSRSKHVAFTVAGLLLLGGLAAVVPWTGRSVNLEPHPTSRANGIGTDRPMVDREGSQADVLDAKVPDSSPEVAANSSTSSAIDPAKDTGADRADPPVGSTAHPDTGELDRFDDSPDGDVRDAVPAEYLPALTHRLLVLLPNRIVLCDVQFVMDRNSHEQYVDRLTHDLLTCADVNHDGEVSWQEITTAEGVRFGQWGNSRIENETQRQEVVYRCDVNRNDRVDATEVATFLAARGTSSSWITTRSTAEVRGPTNGSALFSWLDANRDRQLDRLEIQSAPSRLRMLDREDDSMLVRDDLPGQRETSTQAILNRDAPRRAESPNLALLHEDLDWSRVLFLIEDRYAFGSPVQSTDLPLNTALFQAVDADADGSWSIDEGPGLLHQRADLVLAVQFDDEGPMLRAGAIVEPGDTDGGTETRRSRIRIPLDEGELVIQASAAAEINEPQWNQLWSSWDGDADAALNEDEYRSAESLLAVPWVAADQDGDGRLQSVEGFEMLRRRARAQNAHIQIELEPDNEPIWRYLDLNGDDRLSERELNSTAERLVKIASGLEGIRADDLPPRFGLRFHRGSLDAAPASALAAVPPLAATPSVNRPSWFDPMDLNQDGEISRREFLGPSEILKQLDRNADGLLQTDELPAEN